MPPLKGLACVSLVTFAIAIPSAFAQSNSGNAPAPGAPTMSPTNPSTTPGDQQSGQKAHKHHHRSRSSSATGQPGSTPNQ
jgi:hypothetical protein